MIDVYQELALRAALCPKPVAIAAWRELRSFATIEELDHSVTRILPSIYRNIKEELIGEDRLKLKGSLHHAWARNVYLLHQLHPLVVELSKQNINYRILKGGAIILLVDSPNFRIMGDVDILIAKSDLSRARNALYLAGFLPKYANLCPHEGDSRRNLDFNYVNDKSLEVDIHIPEERSGTSLFEQMLKLPAQTAKNGNLEIKLPEVELLIVHAVVHGLLQVQADDLAQTILDVEVLTPMAEMVRLRREVRELGIPRSFDEYLGVREQILGEHPTIPIRPINLSWPQTINLGRMMRSTLALSLRFLRAIRFRSPRIRDFHKIWKGRSRHRILYLFWLYSGQIRHIEQLITTRFRGFLPRNCSDFKLSPVSLWANDWRFRVTNHMSVEWLEMALASRAFRRQSFLIFCNGSFVTSTSPDKLGKISLRIKKPAKNSEISIRLPVSGCRQCARDLSDLNIFSK